MPRHWWEEEIEITINRLGIMTLLGMMDLALRHPQVPATTSDAGKQIGRQVLEKLLADGLELPDAIKNSYKKNLQHGERINNGTQSQPEKADPGREDQKQ